jgi:hypothetical protein
MDGEKWRILQTNFSGLGLCFTFNKHENLDETIKKVKK